MGSLITSDRQPVAAGPELHDSESNDLFESDPAGGRCAPKQDSGAADARGAEM